MTTPPCNARLWSYDHWHCQRRRFHLGRHRFNNYTAARIPHVWRVRALLEYRAANKRLRPHVKPCACGKAHKRTPLPYREVLYPDRFDPVDPR